jgi:hypothetical protein
MRIWGVIVAAFGIIVLVINVPISPEIAPTTRGESAREVTSLECRKSRAGVPVALDGVRPHRGRTHPKARVAFAVVDDEPLLGLAVRRDADDDVDGTLEMPKTPRGDPRRLSQRAPRTPRRVRRR